MKSNLGHIFLNVSNPEKSFPYFKELLNYFDYEIEFENELYLGMTNGVTDIWLEQMRNTGIINSIENKRE